MGPKYRSGKKSSISEPIESSAYKTDSDKLNSICRIYTNKFEFITAINNNPVDARWIFTSSNPLNTNSSSYAMANLNAYPLDITLAFKHPPAINFSDNNIQIHYNYLTNLHPLYQYSMAATFFHQQIAFPYHIFSDLQRFIIHVHAPVLWFQWENHNPNSLQVTLLVTSLFHL